MAGAGGPLKKDGIEGAIKELERLPPAVRRKVRAALYWMREPKQMILEGFKADILRLYAGYWNALECLVEAVCLMQPASKMKKHEKQEGIIQFLANKGQNIDASSLRECYRLFVDPGFVAKASHALRVSCLRRASGYINECFTTNPARERLNGVRNAINHGEIDGDDLLEMIKVAGKFQRLRMIVLGMLRYFIPFSYPLDPGPT